MLMTQHRSLTGKLVIATHNPGKLVEMRELLAPHGVKAVSAGELGLGEPDETGDTFHANARIKAVAAAKAAKLPAFADDSGLVVDALDGAPGIFSARWAGPNKDFSVAMAQIERLLRERGATEPAQRKAHFVSALCVAWPDDHLEEVEAHAQGTLVWPPRGTAGFGYDPVFLPDGYTRTFVEMTVLRFQQPCPACPDRSRTVLTRVRARDRDHRRAHAGPGGIVDFSRRRHAIIDAAANRRLDPGCDRQALARGARRGSHARSQSHQRRGDTVSRLSRRRRQPGFARRAGAGRRLAEGAGTSTHRARGARRGRDRPHRL